MRTNQPAKQLLVVGFFLERCPSFRGQRGHVCLCKLDTGVLCRTFDRVVLNPKPQLNVIVGPNGESCLEQAVCTRSGHIEDGLKASFVFFLCVCVCRYWKV